MDPDSIKQVEDCTLLVGHIISNLGTLLCRIERLSGVELKEESLKCFCLLHLCGQQRCLKFGTGYEVETGQDLIEGLPNSTP